MEGNEKLWQSYVKKKKKEQSEHTNTPYSK